MSKAPTIIAFPSRKAMAARVADDVEAALGRALAERGSASLAVSGGSTPAALYAELSRRKLDWRSVTAVLVDERWVAPGEEGSNETFVKNTLQQNEAAVLKLIGLWSDVSTPAAGLAAAERRFADIDEAFDIVILGMGVDGHTASWFPHCGGLKRALLTEGSRLAAVTAKQSDVTGTHPMRMTLTLGAIKNAGALCLLTAGEDKRLAYEKALGAGPVEDMPVRAILRARPDMRVFWAP